MSFLADPAANESPVRGRKVRKAVMNRQSGKRRTQCTAAALVLAALLLFSSGCTVKKDYALFSFFSHLQEIAQQHGANYEAAQAAGETGVRRLKDGSLLFSDGSLLSVPDDIPSYNGQPDVTLNGGRPFFEEDLLKKAGVSCETYSPLDSLGRCGTAFACIGRDLMPAEERGSIGMIRPSGWHTARYDFIDGMYLYNRCHLIGYQLTGENANEENLITGTRFMNVDGMLPYENRAAAYIRGKDGHVLYRVTPVFQGDDLLALGVIMEAESLEDRGQSVLFNVFCYNVQPGVAIDYATGENCAS